MKWFQSGPARLPEGLASVSAGSKASISGGVAGSHSIMSVQVKRGESSLRRTTACGVMAQLVSKVLVVLLLIFFFFFILCDESCQTSSDGHLRCEAAVDTGEVYDTCRQASVFAHDLCPLP